MIILVITRTSLAGYQHNYQRTVQTWDKNFGPLAYFGMKRNGLLMNIQRTVRDLIVRQVSFPLS
jgi:hypothetical protein